jgi:bifunctional UDP-N-acetylglucosamine pyrophosphorylase/glucosamine-1-phosphate N-acetyltransferase
VLVLYGDTPLVTSGTLRSLVAAREDAGAAVAVLGMRPPDPKGYGRLRFEGEDLAEIVEERHASEGLKRHGISNSGVMALDAARLPELLGAIPLRPEKNEYYLTDVVALAAARGWRCVAAEGPWEEGVGVNSQAQLADAMRLLQARLRARLLDAGVIMPAPETVYLSADTEVASGAIIEPYCVFGPGVRVAAGAVVHAFSHLEGAVVGAEGERRAVRAAPARDRARRGCEARQLRRGEERAARGRRQGQPPDLPRRRRRRRGCERRRRDHHLQLRRLRQAPDLRSGPARSSARTPRSWPRSGWVPGRSWPPAAP